MKAFFKLWMIIWEVAKLMKLNRTKFIALCQVIFLYFSLFYSFITPTFWINIWGSVSKSSKAYIIHSRSIYMANQWIWSWSESRIKFKWFVNLLIEWQHSNFIFAFVTSQKGAFIQHIHWHETWNECNLAVSRFLIISNYSFEPATLIE